MKFTIDTDEINNDYLKNMEDNRINAIEKFLFEKQIFSENEIKGVLNPKKLKNEEIKQMKSDMGKQISAHANRTFNINGEKDYKSHVYLHKKDTQKIIKLYEYVDNILDLVFSYEVFMQNKAYAVKQSCDVEIPLIRDYGVYSEGSTHYFCIVMDKINYESLGVYLTHSKKECKVLAKKINDANDCLISNKVSHNDLHEENILVSNESKIAFIDFGNATPTNGDTAFKEPFSCEILEKMKKKNEKKKTTSKKNNKKKKNRKNMTKTKSKN
jgi:serine/threonine protein kinase